MQLSPQTLKRLYTLQKQTFLSIGELLPLFYSETGGVYTKLLKNDSAESCLKRKLFYQTYAAEQFENLCSAYGVVWDDLSCFPVKDTVISYENSWMFERTYGGMRGHEGTDLIPSENVSGYYPIVSITDGTVEKIGWLDQGGYRIGIRSPSGAYFYYAHLAFYEKAFQIGERIMAGQILGRMGDTGYGPKGTTGQFAVHLHLGIYIQTKRTEELSVNPYWILRYLELQSENDRNSENASLHLQIGYDTIIG